VIEQFGGGLTVNKTSLISAQPLACLTVSRKVAVAEKTWADVVKELVESMLAVPLRTLQLVEMNGLNSHSDHAVERKCRRDAFLTTGLTGTCISARADFQSVLDRVNEVLDGGIRGLRGFGFNHDRLETQERHGSNLPSSAVKSIAASAKALGS